MTNAADFMTVFGESPVTGKRSTLPPEKLISGAPQHTVHNYYDDPTGQYRAGLWQSTEGQWQAFSGRNEFCHMLSGRVRLTDREGNAKTFVAGDSFVIPPDFDGTWEVLEEARKIYVIFEPNGA